MQDKERFSLTIASIAAWCSFNKQNPFHNKTNSIEQHRLICNTLIASHSTTPLHSKSSKRQEKVSDCSQPYTVAKLCSIHVESSLSLNYLIVQSTLALWSFPFNALGLWCYSVSNNVEQIVQIYEQCRSYKHKHLNSTGLAGFYLGTSFRGEDGKGEVRPW